MTSNLIKILKKKLYQGVLLKKLINLWKKNFKLKEHQIIFVNREHGKSKMDKNIIFEAIIGVIKLKVNSIFKKDE